MVKIRKIQKNKTTTQKTYYHLERAISQNTLLPGQLLVITELAAELGVSRTPVREALLMLEKAGLVEVCNGRMIVSGLHLADLAEVFEFREAIELFALDKLIATGSDTDVQALKQPLEPYQDMPAQRVEAAARADLAFHRALVAHAGNSRMLASWDQMAKQLQRFWHDERFDVARVQADIHTCLRLADLIAERQALAAAQCLRQHLQQTKVALSHWRDVQMRSSQAQLHQLDV